jgi:hypothetical protein
MWWDPEKRPSCRLLLPDGIYHDPTKTNDKGPSDLPSSATAWGALTGCWVIEKQ